MGECLMLRRGGSGELIIYKPPVLDAQYPEDQSVAVVKGQSGMVTFHVAVAEAGVPNTYGYQWYVDGSAVEGETSSVYVKDVSAEGEHRVWCEVAHVSGTVTSRIAALTVKEYYTPVLNSAYPMDASVIAGKSATFSAEILTEGDPAEYTYQWYVDSAAVPGATSREYTHTTEAGSYKSYSVYCVVTNAAGSVTSRIATLSATSAIPAFTYTGDYEIVNDEDSAITSSSGDWKIRFLTSGTLTFTSLNGAADGIDVFCVGGGGNGSSNSTYDNSISASSFSGGGGGGGGYTTTARGISVIKGDEYPIVVGGSTGTSNGFGVVANGGTTASGSACDGAAGGSGGGCGGASGGSGSGKAGGSDGSNGVNGSNHSGGTGQGTTTREFGEEGATLYAGGGGGGGYWSAGAGGAGGGGKGASDTGGTGTAGTANTGGGGGAGKTTPGAGGSGIVIIRNAR